jgi:hypothetical protein
MAFTKISGLWWRESKNGKRYLSGKCGNTSIAIFECDKTKARDPSKAPDYELLLAPVDEALPLTSLPMPQAEAARAQGYAGSKPSHSRPRQAEPPEDHPALDTEIPF